MIEKKTFKLFIISGEPSGDTLGAGIINELKKSTHIKNLLINGVGGSKMISNGLDSIFPMEEISLMGIAEIVPKIFKLNKLINKCVDEIHKFKPDAILTIDSPEFNFRVLKRVRKKNKTFKHFHYVAPSVWAWRGGRAKSIKKYVDHLFCLFSFEKKFFDFPTTFVGHPILNEKLPIIDEGFIRKYDLNREKKYLVILPGSRVKEINSLLPIFVNSAKKIEEHYGLEPIVISLDKNKEIIKKYFDGKIITGNDEKWKALQLCECAIAASGTVTLELLKSNTPSVICYKVDFLTYNIVKNLIRTKYVGLPNIISGKKIMPELLQDNCTENNIFNEMSALLDDIQNIKSNIINVSNSVKVDFDASKKVSDIILESKF